MKIFYTKMIPSLAIRLIKNGSVVSLKLKEKKGYSLVSIDDIPEFVAVELIRDKVVQSVKFYNRFNVLENMDIAND
jgi:hypothetical protein